MTEKERISQSYELAKETYKKWGVDVDAALKELDDISISLHCWQGDDVKSFEDPDAQQYACWQ